MGGYGLAALSGLGQSIPKLAEGMIAGQKLDQHQQALDQQAQFHAAQLANQSTDIGQLFAALGMPMPAGLSGKVPNTIAVAAATKAQADAERKRQMGERESFASSLERMGAATPGTVTSTDAGAPAEGEAGLLGNAPSITTATPGRVADPRMQEAALAVRAGAKPDSLMSLLFPDRKPMVAPPGAHIYENGQWRTPPTPDQAPEATNIDLGSGIVNRTSSDSLTGKVKTSTAPASSDQLMTAHYNRARQLEQKATTGPLTTEEQRQLAESKNAVNTLKPYQIAPGGTQVDRFPPGTPATPNAGGVPGGMRTNPANPSGTDIKDAGDRSNIIQQLEGTANTVRKMDQLQSAGGRGSIAVRAFIQGRTPFETLSPQEQAYVVTHENLRQLLIQAQMGLGPFRSPEMQAQLQNTIGRYWTPGTAERLESLAKLLRGQQDAIGSAEQAGNHRQIHTSPPAAVPRATKRYNPATGQIEAIP